MSILAMRCYGLFAGSTPGQDTKSGLTFTKVVLMYEDGKKHGFKVYTNLVGFENVSFGDKITVEVDTPTLSQFGEMSSYGDCAWKCAGMKLVSEKQAAASLKAAV